MTRPERAAPASFDAYPGLYQGADAAAVSLRTKHYWGEGVILVLNPVSAGLTLLVALGMVRLQGAVLTAVSTTLLVVALWVTRAARWQYEWYECRSAAEDLKRITWRYLMQVEPFGPDEQAPDAAFVRAADEILRSHPGLLAILGRREQAPSPPVTREMQQVRRSSVEERAELYLRSRLRPEAAWYATKARRLGSSDRRWYAALIFVQVAAVVSSIALAVRVLRGHWNSAEDVGVVMLAAVGTSLMGWQRSRRFGDLEASYSATAHALAGMESARPHPSDLSAYQKWLERVEATLAQEHEAWRHMT